MSLSVCLSLCVCQAKSNGDDGDGDDGFDSDDSLGTPVRRKNSAAFENVSGWSCVSAGGRAGAGGRVLV